MLIVGIHNTLEWQWTWSLAKYICAVMYRVDGKVVLNVSGIASKIWNFEDEIKVFWRTKHIRFVQVTKYLDTGDFGMSNSQEDILVVLRFADLLKYKQNWSIAKSFAFFHVLSILMITVSLFVIFTSMKFDIVITTTAGVKKFKNRLKIVSFTSSCRLEHFFILANNFIAKDFRLFFMSVLLSFIMFPCKLFIFVCLLFIVSSSLLIEICSSVFLMVCQFLFFFISKFLFCFKNIQIKYKINLHVTAI